MELMEAIRVRHSVRQYEDRPIEQAQLDCLMAEIAACNAESGLHIQLVTGEKKAFAGFMAHYGGFDGVNSYLAMVGPKSADLDEKCGYYGERLVLLAQTLGLNTCWVKMTYRKVPEALTIGAGEKLAIVISIGYGKTQGVPHKSKPEAAISSAANAPDWYKRGLEAAMLAPTAVNQQKFTLSLDGMTVKARAGMGPCAKIDLGIVKYHFEVGAGRENFTWG